MVISCIGSTYLDTTNLKDVKKFSLSEGKEERTNILTLGYWYYSDADVRTSLQAKKPSAITINMEEGGRPHSPTSLLYVRGWSSIIFRLRQNLKRRTQKQKKKQQSRISNKNAAICTVG